MPAMEYRATIEPAPLAWDREPGSGERVLLRALRRVAFGGAGTCSAEAEFVAACGSASGPTAWVAFRAFLVLLSLYGRRPLVLAPPGWPEATADEIRLVQLFAAAQAGAEVRVAAHLAWLLRPACAENAPAMVACIARALAEGGLRLRLAPAPRTDPRPLRCAAR